MLILVLVKKPNSTVSKKNKKSFFILFKSSIYEKTDFSEMENLE
ncbi:hypothetical protein LCGC14_2369940 [marine sediment metagenome]|uniref:Uncharacterized protein n=1 Tax=marine sediment metagenome TaxID=412755 RepID=A0A0F9EYS5_9ZZZZ